MKNTKSKPTKKRILIIEDNELNLKLFRDLLEVNNYEVHDIRDARQVISAVRELKPNLVLMDIQLNNASGLELVKDIKADPEIASTPVIAVTAFVMRDDKERMLASGFEAYIPKPISIDSFVATVQKFIS